MEIRIGIGPNNEVTVTMDTAMAGNLLGGLDALMGQEPRDNVGGLGALRSGLMKTLYEGEPYWWPREEE